MGCKKCHENERPNYVLIIETSFEQQFNRRHSRDSVACVHRTTAIGCFRIYVRCYVTILI